MLECGKRIFTECWILIRGETWSAQRKTIYQLRITNSTQTREVRETRGCRGWHSGESTRLPPMWPGFDSQIRRQMSVEFVGSVLRTERFSPGTPVSSLLKNQNLT